MKEERIVGVYVILDDCDKTIKGVYTDPCETRVRRTSLAEETKSPYSVVYGTLVVSEQQWTDRGETS